MKYRLLMPLAVVVSRVLGFLKHRFWRRAVPFELPNDLKLHIGSGREALPGWVNIDIQRYSEVDVALDVTKGLPYVGVRRIFSEHFLEHLDVESALAFLEEANRALAEGGWLRLTTPNLDWVWHTIYSPDQDDPARLVRGIHANRSFYGWQHRFLWNRELLAEALYAAGFSDLRWCDWGRSDLVEFDGLERHERYPDTRDIPHVLVVEACKGSPDRERRDAFMAVLRAEFLGSLDD